MRRFEGVWSSGCSVVIISCQIGRKSRLESRLAGFLRASWNPASNEVKLMPPKKKNPSLAKSGRRGSDPTVWVHRKHPAHQTGIASSTADIVGSVSIGVEYD